VSCEIVACQPPAGKKRDGRSSSRIEPTRNVKGNANSLQKKSLFYLSEKEKSGAVGLARKKSTKITSLILYSAKEKRSSLPQEDLTRPLESTWRREGHLPASAPSRGRKKDPPSSPSLLEQGGGRHSDRGYYSQPRKKNVRELPLLAIGNEGTTNHSLVEEGGKHPQQRKRRAEGTCACQQRAKGTAAIREHGRETVNLPRTSSQR